MVQMALMVQIMLEYFKAPSSTFPYPSPIGLMLSESSNSPAHPVDLCFFPGLPAVFVTAWASVRATLADTE